MNIDWTISRINVLFQSEKNKSESLQIALTKVRIFEAFLSICCVCKKIRNEDGNCQYIESYISGHSETQFPHTSCPECAMNVMEEVGLIKR